MEFNHWEEAGDHVLELDEEGIDWLRQGLEALEVKQPGEYVSSVELSPDGVGRFVLLRA